MPPSPFPRCLSENISPHLTSEGAELVFQILVENAFIFLASEQIEQEEDQSQVQKGWGQVGPGKGGSH